MSEILNAIGKDWRALPPGRLEQTYKTWRNRPRLVGLKSRLVDAVLPEYKTGPARLVLDVACGSGVFLEIMRHYGHGILGTEVKYFDYLESQNIPHIVHDGSQVPYPFADQSVDLVTCMAAISLFRQPWETTLGELFRIARQTVLVVANSGPNLDRNIASVLTYRPPGWRLEQARETIFKWVRS